MTTVVSMPATGRRTAPALSRPRRTGLVVWRDGSVERVVSDR
jgi:hypothetical protein